MKLYREVKCSDRLPKKHGWYVVKEQGTGHMKRAYYGKFRMSVCWHIRHQISSYADHVIKATHWLEPIEITENQIRSVFGEYADEYDSLSYEMFKAVIINLLKEE